MQRVFIIVVCCILLQHQTWARCQNKQTTGSDDVTGEEEDVVTEYVQVGYSKELMCHVPLADQSKVYWFFQKKESNVWQPYPFSWGVDKFGFRNVELPASKKNRTLLILSSTASAQGMYKCVSQNIDDLAKAVRIVYSLEVFDCVPGRREPVIRKPRESQLAGIGEEVKVNCMADFGCDDDDSNAVDWLIMEEKELLCITDLNDPHYSVKLVNKNIGRLLNSTLMIRVKEVDFSRTFGCMVSSVNNADGKPKVFPFKLRPKVIVADSKPVITTILAVAIPAILVVVLVSAVVLYCCGPSIRLYCRAHCGYLQTDKERNQNDYDVAIIHDDEQNNDRILVKKLSDELIKNKVRVATIIEGENITAGEDEVLAIMNLLQVSASVIFVVPNSDHFSHKLNNLYNYIETGGFIPLKFVLIVGAPKSSKGHKRDGIYARMLNHFKRPKDSEIHRFCTKLMLKLPLYNSGGNLDSKRSIEVPLQHQGKVTKDFHDIHFIKEKVLLIQDQKENELEIEAKLPLMEENKDGKLNDPAVFIEKEEEETAVVIPEEVDEEDDNEEGSSRHIDTQAVVHHSHSSVEDLDDIVVNTKDDGTNDTELVTLHVSC